jgi:prepilin-type N-terminal cleavage/methylation domain-containing protein
MRGRLWVVAERGFSLIELIGVLAIMGILASMTVPPILRQIRQAQSGNEDANLNEVARAIVEGIKVTGTIPNPNVGALAAGGWASNSLPYTALGTNQLLYVSDANTNTQRRMYLSGGLANYCVASGYSTPTAGWLTNSFPSDLQIVLVSSSREDLLLSCSASNNLASNGVVWLKNWVKQATNGIYFATNTLIVGGIAGSTGTWTNKGEFLHVKVVDLRPLFCRVDLEDLRSPVTASIFGTGGSNYPVVSSTNTHGITMQVYANATSPSNLTSVAIVSGAGKNLWSVSGNTNIAVTTNLTISSGSGSNGDVSLVFPSAPQFGVGTNQLIMSAQDLSFYLIKGTSLNLSGTSVMINQDSKFQYSNGTWRQLY